MTRMRLRQLVIAAETLETARQLRTVFGLGKPYHDPGVREFGLENAVFAIGQQFIEIIAPTTKDAPARRFLDRNGEGGYMAIFQTGDIAGARNRLDQAGIRRVWNIDLDDIAASHVHPADVGGAIVSLDEAHPWDSWRWAGPDWQEETIEGEISGAIVKSPDPRGMASRWAAALGRPATTGVEKTTIQLDGNTAIFEQGPQDRLETFCMKVNNAMKVLERADRMKLVSEGDGDGVLIGGVRFELNNI
jgi:hypothetical protein